MRKTRPLKAEAAAFSCPCHLVRLVCWAEKKNLEAFVTASTNLKKMAPTTPTSGKFILSDNGCVLSKTGDKIGFIGGPL